MKGLLRQIFRTHQMRLKFSPRLPIARKTILLLVINKEINQKNFVQLLEGKIPVHPKWMIIFTTDLFKKDT